MARRFLLASVLVLSAMALVSLPSVSFSAAPAKNVVFVRVAKTGGRYELAVDGKQIPATAGKLPYVDLDKALGESFKDKDQTVAIVLSDKVSLEDALLVRTVAQKVGYRSVRFFLAKSGAKSMSELVFGPQFQLPEPGQSELVGTGPP